MSRIDRNKGGKTVITCSIGFEIELNGQSVINIDDILMSAQKYRDSHCDDKEVLVTIQKAVDTSPELRSKERLSENFFAWLNEVDKVIAG